jgi:two-component system, NtrC family, sensor histidine kinase HydH
VVSRCGLVGKGGGGEGGVPDVRGSGIERPFSLVRWFAAVGLVCVALAAFGAGSMLTRFLTHYLLARDAEVSADYLGSIVRTGNYEAYFADGAPPAAREGLETFFRHIAELPDVVRANVYSVDGIVLWSNNPRLIGQRLGPNEELERAISGEIEITTGVVGEDAKTEHASFGIEARGLRFVENYLPIWDAKRNRVIGVVEFYRLPVSLFRAVDQGTYLVWGGAAVCAAFLYGALFWVVRRADRLIRHQRERLVEAETLATVGVFASAVAHGIRNPLAIIRSSAELAREEDEEEARRETLTDILRETDRLDSWIRDMLMSARGETTATGAVDVNALLQASAQSFAAAAERRRVRFLLRAQAVPPARAEAGPLARAIDNIVANAIEAMPEGGTLLIESRPAGLGKAIEIRVVDSGKGMSPEVAHRITRPFASTKPSGTGLGLALARRIVASYAGTLTLDTAEGRGTTVTIRLLAAA